MPSDDEREPGLQDDFLPFAHPMFPQGAESEHPLNDRKIEMFLDDPFPESTSQAPEMPSWQVKDASVLFLTSV